jgi:hypothetical protein
MQETPRAGSQFDRLFLDMARIKCKSENLLPNIVMYAKYTVAARGTLPWATGMSLLENYSVDAVLRIMQGCLEKERYSMLHAPFVAERDAINLLRVHYNQLKEIAEKNRAIIDRIPDGELKRRRQFEIDPALDKQGLKPFLVIFAPRKTENLNISYFGNN